MVNLIKPGLEEWISQCTTTKKLIIYGLITAALTLLKEMQTNKIRFTQHKNRCQILESYIKVKQQLKKFTNH